MPSARICSGASASVVRSVRCAAVVPCWTTSTGVSAGRPPSSRTLANSSMRSTAISSTIVPDSAASAFQFTNDSGWSGATMAADHHELVGDAPVGDRNTRQRGNRYGTCHTGHDGDRNARLGARDHLLVAAGEHERIAALEPHHELARPGPVDQHVVDRVLRHRPAVRDLRGVDHLDVRRELGEQFRRRQPVGDHDVGLRQQPAAAHGDQFGVAGAAADQRDARRAARRVDLVGDHAALQRLVDRRCGWPPSGGAPRRPARPTDSPSYSNDAGVTAVPSRATSARTQKMRLRSASATTAALTSGSSVAAIAYQAPSRSPSR